MKHSVQSSPTKTGRGEAAHSLLLARKHAVREKICSEKRVTAFSDLGWRLSGARNQRDAARILMDAADELFGWDACRLDLYSAAEGSMCTALYVDTIEGKRVDVSSRRNGTKPSARTLELIERGAQLILNPHGSKFGLGENPFDD